MLKAILRGSLAVAALLFFCSGSKAQQFELLCPAGSYSVQSLQTFDNSTGKYRQNYCVDANGNVTANAGGGITSVTTLPATCTVGTLVFLTVSSTGFPIGQYSCLTPNTFSFVGPDLTNVINPRNFGVTMNALMCRDTNAQFTTTTSVTCLTANFTSADIGKVIFGTCCGLQGGSTHFASTLILPQGTITAVNSPTNVTVSLAGNATTCAAGATGCLLIWGTDDTAAWALAWTAATGTAGHCYSIQMGAGMTIISSAIALTTVCNTGITGPGSQGSSIVGLGYKSSQFIIAPLFSAASCLTTVNRQRCIFPDIGFQFINSGIWGGEYGNSTNFNGKTFLTMAIDTYYINVLLAGLASSSSSTMIGIQSAATGQTPSTLIVDGFGGGTSTAPSCFISGGNYNIFVESFCGNVAGQALQVSGPGVIFTDFGGLYGQVGGSSDDVDVINGAKANFRGTILTGPNAGAALGVDGSSSVDLDSSIVSNVTNAGLFFSSGAGGKVRAKNTTFTGSGVGTDIAFSSATNNIWQDQGGNILTNSSATATACASGASPAVCRNYGSGSIAVPAGTNVALVVNTTAVSANSLILFSSNSTTGTKLGVTCNSTLASLITEPVVTARTAGVSFTVTISGTTTTNPVCLDYLIVPTNN